MPHDLRGPTEEEQLQFLKEMAKQAKYGGASDVTPDIAGLGLGAKALGPLNSLIMGLVGQSTGAQADPNTQPLDLGLLSQAVVPGPVKLARAAAMSKTLPQGSEKVQLVPQHLFEPTENPISPRTRKLIGVLESIPRVSMFVKGRGPQESLGKYKYRDIEDLNKAEYLDTDALEIPFHRNLSKTGPRAVGPKFVREVLEYLASSYPQAKELGGTRISGVRERMNVRGAKQDASYNLQRLSPESEAEALKILQGASQYLNKRISSGIKVDKASDERDIIRKFLGMPSGYTEQRTPLNIQQRLEDLNPTAPPNLGEATIDQDNLFEALGRALGLPR